MKLEMKEGREGSSTWYGGVAVMGVGKYEEGSRAGPGVTCENAVVGGTL